VVRQPTFAGSTRAARGALVRALAAAPGRTLPITELAQLTPRPDLILASLERDGLVHRRGALALLGGRASGGSASTIES
jgi:hypothetical protein